MDQLEVGKDAGRVLIAHDFMETYGGAERVTQEMALAFPDAHVVTILGRRSVAERMGVADRFRSLLPARERLLRDYRLLTPLFPALTEATRLEEADVLLTSSYAFVHGFRTVNDAPQACYCHSPLRFAWTMTETYRRTWAPNAIASRAFDVLAASVRQADLRSSRRVTRYLTQSRYTADQIDRHYGRRAEIIGVPIDCDLFHPNEGHHDDYYLLCCRLIEPYKRASIVIEAFRHLPHKLIVAGDGPALPQLRAVAPPNVEFVGHLTDGALVDIMQHCAAGIFPSRDDFGLVPLEIMACGRPVLAYAGGGAAQTVVPGMSGDLFHDQTPGGVIQAVRAFEPESYHSDSIRAHAGQWSRKTFRRKLVEAVKSTAAVG